MAAVAARGATAGADVLLRTLPRMLWEQTQRNRSRALPQRITVWFALGLAVCDLHSERQGKFAADGTGQASALYGTAEYSAR